jgi:hypothetical protein
MHRYHTNNTLFWIIVKTKEYENLKAIRNGKRKRKEKERKGRKKQKALSYALLLYIE